MSRALTEGTSTPRNPVPGDESALRAKAREAMRSGKMPKDSPHRTWGGRGDGVRCTICEEPVLPSEVEFELEFAPSNGGGPTSHHVHQRCFAAWEFEREDLGDSVPLAPHPAALNGSQSPPGSNMGGRGASVSGNGLSPSVDDGTMAAGERASNNRRGTA